MLANFDSSNDAAVVFGGLLLFGGAIVVGLKVAWDRGWLPLAVIGMLGVWSGAGGTYDGRLRIAASALGAVLAATAVLLPPRGERPRRWLHPLGAAWAIAGAGIAALLVYNGMFTGASLHLDVPGQVTLPPHLPVAMQEIVIDTNDAPRGTQLRVPRVSPADERVQATVLGPDGQPAGLLGCGRCTDRYLAVFTLADDGVPVGAGVAYELSLTGETWHLYAHRIEDAPEFVRVTINDVDSDPVRVAARDGFEVPFTSARPFALARVTVVVPAAAIPEAGLGTFPTAWTARLTATKAALAHPIEGGFGNVVDVEPCQPQQSCVRQRYVLIRQDHPDVTPASLGLDVFAAADYLTRPYPPNGTSIDLEVAPPSLWTRRTSTGNFTAESDLSDIRIEFGGAPGADVVAVRLITETAQGLTRRVIQAVECRDAQCAMRFDGFGGGPFEWTVDAYWALFDAEEEPPGFDPQIVGVDIEPLEQGEY